MQMKLKSKDGVEMMDVKSIAQDGDRIFIKGKMMGAMATTIVVTPEALFDAYCLAPGSVIRRLPVLLYKGWRTRKKAEHG